MPPAKVFCDSSFLIAALNKKEGERHFECRAKFEKLIKDKVSLIITWYVFHETSSILMRKCGTVVWSHFIRSVLPSLEVFELPDKFEFDTLDHYKSWIKKDDVSFCDVLSFRVINEFLNRIPIAEEDRHFRAVFGLATYS